MAKIMSSIIGWISSSTFLAISENHYFSWVTHWFLFWYVSQKITILIWEGKFSPYRTQTHISEQLFTESCPVQWTRWPLLWCLIESSSYTSAQCSCPGPADVSPPAQTSISISGWKKKHVVSCHQLYIHSQADSPIHKPTVKNNALLTLRFLIFDKIISKLKWKK